MHFKRDSIFLSPIRKLLNAFGIVFGIALALFVIVLGINALSTNVTLPTKSELTISSDANWNRTLLPHTAPVLLRIPINGVIGTLDLTEKKFREMLLSSREDDLANNRVKGVLLYINTPGGTVTDSVGIYRALKTYKEKFHVPIFVYVEGMCASGGMYIAAVADQVFASEDSVIGSVGVLLGPVFNFSELIGKVGVQSLSITAGKDKDMLNPFRPWKPEEDASIKTIVEAEYVRFVDVVTVARKGLNKELLINEYGAQVFDAAKSKELGFIDAVDVSYEDVLTSLARAAGIKEEEKYQVFSIEPSHSFLQGLTENKWDILHGKINHVFPLGPNMTTEMSGKLLFLYQP